MLDFDFRKLFEALEKTEGLQRKDWELNQSGPDRGMESVLIQRTRREVATYALIRLRLESIPGLLNRCAEEFSEKECENLLKWGRSQGGGGSMMAKKVEDSVTREYAGRIAALASLRYYHKREDKNPAVKVAWTDEGFRTLLKLDVDPLLCYPTRGSVWLKKMRTLQSLTRTVTCSDFAAIGDKEVVHVLKSIDGVGDQTAAMTALFWLQRPVPVIDSYLLRLLESTNLVAEPVKNSRMKGELHDFLSTAAREIEANRPDWPAWRVLSSLYLWACEVGRFSIDVKI